MTIYEQHSERVRLAVYDDGLVDLETMDGRGIWGRRSASLDTAFALNADVRGWLFELAGEGARVRALKRSIKWTEDPSEPEVPAEERTELPTGSTIVTTPVPDEEKIYSEQNDALMVPVDPTPRGGFPKPKRKAVKRKKMPPKKKGAS